MFLHIDFILNLFLICLLIFGHEFTFNKLTNNWQENVNEATVNTLYDLI